MSAAWGSAGTLQECEIESKRMIRLWGMLAVAGCFLLFVYYNLHMRLF